MKLQIIIPHYKDKPQYVERLLNSIAIQQNINFTDIAVIIVNDGSEIILDSSLFSSYPFQIQYFVTTGGGVSAARQYGMDKSTAEYIMFADCDDMFYRATALYDILDTIDTKHPDMITSKFVTDLIIPNSTKKKMREYNNDNVFIHGKVFNRAFLLTHHISGDPALKVCEDSRFVRWCLAFHPNKVNIEETTWLGKYRPDSITRQDDYGSDKVYIEKMLSNASLVRALIASNLIDQAKNYVYVQMYECYFTLQQTFGYTKQFVDLVPKILHQIKEYYNEFKDLFYSIGNENKRIIIEVLRDRFYKQRNRIALESITFDQGLKQVLENN